jgi:replicative DNA helicase
MTAELSDLWSLEAEEAVLGSLMIDNSSIIKIIPILKEGDFYREKHQYIFEAIRVLHECGCPCDPVTLTDEIERKGQLGDVGGPAAITELFQRVPTALHVEYYAGIVAEFGALRRLVWVGEATAAAAHERESVTAIRQKIEKWLGQAAPLVRNTIDHINPAITDALYQLEQIRNGESDYFLPSFSHDVDRVLGGYARGECTVIGNFTGNGKTAWALQELRDKARRGFGGVYVSTEMYAHVLGQRNLSSIAQVNLWQVRRGFRESDLKEQLPYACHDWSELEQKLKHAQDELHELPLHVMAKVRDPQTRRVTSPDLTPSGVRAAIRAYAEKYPVDFIVFDYLTNFDMSIGRGSSDRSLIVEEGLRTFRETANEVGAAAIVLAQYSREASKSEVPKLHHLEQSTGIEKGADNVWLGYSPDSENEHIQALDAAKGRNSGKGLVEGLWFDGAIQTFTDPYIRRMAPDHFTDW